MSVRDITEALQESELVDSVVIVEDDRLGDQTFPATYYPADYEQEEVVEMDGFETGTLFQSEEIDDVPEGTHSVVYFPGET